MLYSIQHCHTVIGNTLTLFIGTHTNWQLSTTLFFHQVCEMIHLKILCDFIVRVLQKKAGKINYHGEFKKHELTLEKLNVAPKSRAVEKQLGFH